MDNNATISRPCNQCGCRGLGQSISNEDLANQMETSHCTDDFFNNSNDRQTRGSIGPNNLKEALKRRATANSEGENSAGVDSKRTRRNTGKNIKDDLKNKSSISKQIMYYCEYCDTCSTYKSGKTNDKVSHYSGKCMSFPAKFCTDCGLKFTIHLLKNHGPHGKQNNLEDFKFCRWQDEKPLINPPIPRYPYCAKCNLYFIPSTEDMHNCSVMGENKGKMCDICDKTYDEEAYKVHLNFHSGAFSKDEDKIDDNLAHVEYKTYDAKACEVHLKFHSRAFSKNEDKIEDNIANVDKFDKNANNKVEDTKCEVKEETVVKFLRCKSCTAAYHIKAYAERHKCGMSLRYCITCQLYIPEIHYKKHLELHDKLENMEIRKEITEF